MSRAMPRKMAELVLRSIAGAPTGQVTSVIRERAARALASQLSNAELGAELSFVASQPLTDVSPFVRALAGGRGSEGPHGPDPTVVRVGEERSWLDEKLEDPEFKQEFDRESARRRRGS